MKFDNPINQINVESKSNFFENEDIDLKDIWKGILRKRNWAYASGAIIFSATILFTIFQRVVNPVYVGRFSLLIKDPLATEDNRGRNLTPEGIGFYETLSSQAFSYDLNTLERYLRSPKFLQNLAINHDISAVKLSNSIKISRTNNMSNRFEQSGQGVLDIRFTTKNFKKGKKVIKNLANIYLQESLIRKQQKIKDGLSFLNKQAPFIKNEEIILQNKLVDFREKHKLIDPFIEGENLKEEEKLLKEMILNFETAINRLKNVRKEIKNGTLSARGFQEELGNGLSVSDFDQGLLSELLNIEKEIAIAKSKYTSNSSIIKGLQSRLFQIQPALLENQLEAVDIAISLNESRLKNTQNILEEKQIVFQKLPKIIKEYQKIEQDLSFANKKLLDLNTTIASFELELAQTTIPWRIISDPVMLRKPISPSISKNLSYGFLYSLIFGLVISLLRDRFDHVFNSSEDVTKTLETPLLGSFPYIEGFSNLRDEKLSIFKLLEEIESSKSQSKEYVYQRFAFTESLRNIYTSIKFSNPEKKIKTLLITSSIPREGKSLFNILLGKIISEMEGRVLLIDADMRKPSVHMKLDIDNILGLSNYLSDENITLDQIIQPIKKIPNLSCITAGAIPPDPTRLLSSSRFSKLVETFKNEQNFDIIIFDSPPILGLADSIIISQIIDGSILLVSLNFIDRSTPKESLKNLKTNNTNFLGVISNSVKENRDELFNYGNNYSYNYTYANYLPDNSKKTNEKTEKETQQIFSKFNNQKINKLIYEVMKIKNKILKWLD